MESLPSHWIRRLNIEHATISQEIIQEKGPQERNISMRKNVELKASQRCFMRYKEQSCY